MNCVMPLMNSQKNYKKAFLTGQETWHAFYRVWKTWGQQHRNPLILVLLFIALIATTTGLYPILINKAYDSFQSLDKHALFIAPLFVIVVTLVKGLALYGQVVLTNRVVTRVEVDMQSALYAHLMEADMAQLDQLKSAALTQRFITDFGFIREAFTRMITVLLRDMATVIALIAAMVWLEPTLTLWAVVITPLAAWPIGRISRTLRRVATSTQEETGDMASLVVESLSSMRLVKVFLLESYLKARTQKAFERIRVLKMKAARARGSLDPLLEVGAGFAVALVLIFIGWRVTSHESTVGQFTGFVTAFLLAAQPIRSIGNLMGVIQEAMAALTRYFALLDEKPSVMRSVRAQPLTLSKGELAFHDVSFSYGGHGALESISCVVPPGRITALVGRSGAGKSTLLSLIPRLYDPNAGMITIDSQDISHVTLESLRAQIAVVSQDVALFDDTIRANLIFDRSDISDDVLKKAAEIAGAHAFIERLPQGYDTYVGERGARLSGGERQRIAIARALLKDAPILLLDEATSALDTESERIITQAMNRLMQGRTTLVIAHRLSTVCHAHQIIVLDEGKISEIGDHHSLMAQQGLYKHLYQMQFHGAPREAYAVA